MTISLGSCYLTIRDVMPDGGPELFDGWTARAESDGWYTVTRESDGLRVLVWRANTDSTGERGLFAVHAPLEILQALQAAEPLTAPASSTWTAAKAGNATAIAVARRWPTWRYTGHERLPSGSSVAVTQVVRRLIHEGQQLPTPATAFPWRFAADGSFVGTDGEAQYRVGTLASMTPALHTTVASYALHEQLEAQT